MRHLLNACLSLTLGEEQNFRRSLGVCCPLVAQVPTCKEDNAVGAILGSFAELSQDQLGSARALQLPSKA